MTIGELIYQQRKKLQMTLEDVSRICNVPCSTVSRWENGHIKKISRDNMEKLCMHLNIDPIVFFQKNELLSLEEMEMLKAYRKSDDRAKQDAMKMLKEHAIEGVN